MCISIKRCDNINVKDLLFKPFYVYGGKNEEIYSYSSISVFSSPVPSANPHFSLHCHQKKNVFWKTDCTTKNTQKCNKNV